MSATLAEMRVRVTGDPSQDSEGGGAEEQPQCLQEPLLQNPEELGLKPQCLLGIDKEPLLQNPDGIGKTMSLTHLRDQEDTGVDYSLRIHTCLTPLFG